MSYNIRMTCPNCQTMLVPYVYAEPSRQLYQAEREGILLIGMDTEFSPGYPTYYCKYCKEDHYFTDAHIVKKASKRSYAKKQKLN